MALSFACPGEILPHWAAGEEEGGRDRCPVAATESGRDGKADHSYRSIEGVLEEGLISNFIRIV